MIYKVLADLVVVLHLGFILFVIFGALFVFKFPKLAWLHVPVATYAMMISFYRWICPLTPLEKYFLALAGEQGYEGGFIGHYLIPVIYPGGMTQGIAIFMGLFVLTWNAICYGVLIYRIKKQ